MPVTDCKPICPFFTELQARCVSTLGACTTLKKAPNKLAVCCSQDEQAAPPQALLTLQDEQALLTLQSCTEEALH